MNQPFYLLEQAERCRRLTHDSTGARLRDNLLKLGAEYNARASAQENGTAVRQADADDKGNE
jgi:hypothetical protein